MPELQSAVAGSTGVSRYGSRKFIVAIIGMVIAAGLRWRGVLTDDSTTTVLITAILGYQAGNVGGKLADAKAKA